MKQLLYGLRRHSMRGDGPVSGNTGSTTNGVVTIARINVPIKPIRHRLPQHPVRTYTIMQTIGLSMRLGLAGPRLSCFGGLNHSRIGWHTAEQIKCWSLPPPWSFQHAQKSLIEKAWHFGWNL